MRSNPLYHNLPACLLVIVAIMVAGIYQFLHLPVALYPSTSQPKVTLWIQTEAMTALEFRAQYGKNLESSLRAIDGVTRVEGGYRRSSAAFDVYFKWGVASDDAKASVKAVIDPFASRFPRHWQPPYLYFSGQYSSRFLFTLASDDVQPAELSRFLQYQLSSKLRSVPGLADLWTIDWSKRRVVIELIPERLNQFGLAIDDVLTTLTKSELDSSLGSMSTPSGSTMSVLLANRVTSLADLKSKVVAVEGNRSVRVEQIADVHFDSVEYNEIFKTNGVQSLIVGGYAKPDANIKDVADRFVQVLEQETKAYKFGKIQINPLLSPAEFIDGAVDNVLQAVLGGIIITVLITYFFLGSVFDTLIVCLTIPLSGLGGFILMRILGIEINLISMGAMALAVGMVVDGATVVLENIVRVVGDQTTNLRAHIETGARQVQGAVFASLLTTIIVFLPLPFTSPLSAAVLGDLAVVIVCVMVVSIAVTIWVIPPLLFHIYRLRALKRPLNKFGDPWLLTKFQYYYARCEAVYIKSLQFLLSHQRHRRQFYGGCVVLFVVGLALLTFAVRREVMAEPETNKIFAFLEIRDTNLSMEDRGKIVDFYEQKLSEKFRKQIVSSISQVSKGESFVLFTIPRSSQMAAFKAKLEQELVDTVAIKFRIEDWSPTALEIPDPPLYRINVEGVNDGDRRERLARVEKKLKDKDQFGSTSSQPRTDKEKLIRLSAKPWLASVPSIDTRLPTPNESQAAMMLQGILKSQFLYDLDLNGESTGLFLEAQKKRVQNVNDLENLQTRVGTKLLPLRSLFNFTVADGWTDMFTVDGEFRAFVDVWPKAADKYVSRSKMRGDVTAALAELDQEDRPFVSTEDRDSEITENLYSLLAALGFSLLLIVTVMVFQFGSMRAVAIVMAAVPLGIVGCGLALWMFQSTLSINSMLGLILLGGTAVNNSIVLLDFYLGWSGTQDPAERIVQVARLRLRPILITALTTVFGMLPIAFAWGEGATILQPLGITVSAGLGISTLLTLLVVPCLLFDVPPDLQPERSLV